MPCYGTISTSKTHLSCYRIYLHSELGNGCHSVSCFQEKQEKIINWLFGQDKICLQFDENASLTFITIFAHLPDCCKTLRSSQNILILNLMRQTNEANVVIEFELID